MPLFLADIAGMLELFAVAAGLVLLHQASKEPAKLLTAAGWVLIAGGAVAGGCTSYYWFKYQSRGAFDGAHMGTYMDGAGMMHGGGRDVDRSMMGPGTAPLHPMGPQGSGAGPR